MCKKRMAEEEPFDISSNLIQKRNPTQKVTDNEKNKLKTFKPPIIGQLDDRKRS
jgi:hypothetical protein